MSDLRATSIGVLRTLRSLVDELASVLESVESTWSFPIGTEEFPPQDWYVALLHDPTGKRNVALAGRLWPHTGVDYNVQILPRGDIDRGQPVWAIADGIVSAKAYSTNYLASVVILVAHDNEPLYVRYWHLAKDSIYDALCVGMRFEAGMLLGHLGDYRMGGGGDHLHFDMAFDPFEPLWWFTNHKYVRWCDPVPILKAHLDSDLVDASLRRGS